MLPRRVKDDDDDDEIGRETSEETSEQRFQAISIKFVKVLADLVFSRFQLEGVESTKLRFWGLRF